MRLSKLFLVLLCFPVFLSANIGTEGFHAFKKRVFVETGTYGGTGIKKALQAGFQEVHSLELDETLYKNAVKRYQSYTNVHIYHADSSKDLLSVIQSIHEPVTFWLDAHNGFPDPNDLETKNTPLMEELDQIKQHPIKTHTILIDDLHCCDTLLFDFISLDEIIEKVLEINPDYHIFFIPGGDDDEYPENILVAMID